MLRQAGDDDDDVDGGGGVGAGVGGGATAAASDEEINGGSIETNVVSQYSCDEQKETVQIRTKGRQTDLSYKEALYTREFVLVRHPLPNDWTRFNLFCLDGTVD